ncbi:MAG: hypothetical protein JWO06_2490 [Bacteroidota bacterium]|nr:hypothetical protein [Bacteroidota bacterium]
MRYKFTLSFTLLLFVLLPFFDSTAQVPNLLGVTYAGGGIGLNTNGTLFNIKGDGTGFNVKVACPPFGLRQFCFFFYLT